ncbi:proton extrusion protein PcxA [Argonema antarcticum]|uniref:proton extrusion protein PcxA n=1 Tax=Argonema antarcticum TaxID=2942763 RepID=UPI002011BC69|nr:proton extrusion protein PcxA [Argonema antarcticum]MCL1473992.1 proton extrusion protein PcxA [Argonema antarcticum A004/B2]
MKRTILTKIIDSLRYAAEWFSETPERALEQAYNAALQIKAIEDEYFGGKKIVADSADYTDSEMSYFRAELQKNLNITKGRLAEFRASNSVIGISNYNQTPAKAEIVDASVNNGNVYSPESRDKSAIILEKLKFIDRVISKYTTIESQKSQPEKSLALVAIAKNQSSDSEKLSSPISNEQLYLSTPNSDSKADTISDKTGVLPRSIFKTINRLQRELDPQSEEEVVKKFRKSKAKTAISLRFLLILIIAPLLTYQLSKLFVVGPLVDNFRTENELDIFINRDLEEEALSELTRFKERLEFENLIFEAPKFSPEQIEEQLKEKAKEIAKESRHQSADAIKNIFSDLLSLVAFAVVIFMSRREIAVLKSFIDELVYGLSDSAKAFIIILFTDVFVGFHSPHGWEVLLENVSRHLGLPENRDFIFLFIATFPVILDTVFKYWIFRYLNRISPSAVATYRNMNE